MRIAMRALLGLDPDEAGRGAAAAHHFERALGFYGIDYQLRLLRGPGSPWRKLVASRKVLDEIVFAEIERCRAAPDAERQDILSLLLGARGEAGEAFTDREVRDQAMTLMFAGHDTSTSTLSFMMHELARHPDVVEKLCAEQDEVLGGEPPDVDSLEQMPYLDMVLDEVLRLYPPAWIGPRRAVREFEFGGYTVPRDAYVNYCSWASHRIPEVFPEPEAFIPERFTPRAQGGAAARRLRPLRRRQPHLHRQALRPDGGEAGGDDAAPAPAPRRASRPHDDRAPDAHPLAEGRSGDADTVPRVTGLTRWALWFGGLAFFTCYLGQTALGVIQPTIVADLHLSEAEGQWVVNAFFLTLALFAAPGGRLGDYYGHRQVLLFAFAVFAVGALSAAVSQGFVWLVASIAVSGAGASTLYPASAAMIANRVPQESRGRAIGAYSAIGVSVLTLGPVLAGVLTEAIDWRALFALQAAVGASLVVVGALKVDNRPVGEPEPFDTTGLVVLFAGLTALLVALMQALAWGWDSPATLSLFGVGLAAARRLRRARAAHPPPAARRRPAAQPSPAWHRAGDVRRADDHHQLHHLHGDLLPARARLRPAARLPGARPGGRHPAGLQRPHRAIDRPDRRPRPGPLRLPARRRRARLAGALRRQRQLRAAAAGPAAARPEHRPDVHLAAHRPQQRGRGRRSAATPTPSSSPCAGSAPPPAR